MSDVDERLDEVRKHPAYKLFDGYVVDFDLRGYTARVFQKSSEQAKAMLLLSLLNFLNKGKEAGIEE